MVSFNCISVYKWKSVRYFGIRLYLLCQKMAQQKPKRGHNFTKYGDYTRFKRPLKKVRKNHEFQKVFCDLGVNNRHVDLELFSVWIGLVQPSVRGCSIFLEFKKKILRVSHTKF